jgi:hypothetical protein
MSSSCVLVLSLRPLREAAFQWLGPNPQKDCVQKIAVILRKAPRKTVFTLRARAPTEESLRWAHGPVGYVCFGAKGPPVPDKDSSVGAQARVRLGGMERAPLSE